MTVKTRRRKVLSTALIAVTAASLNGLTLEVQKFEEGQPLPAGYQDVTDGIEAGEIINVSADPFVDYLIPRNSSPGGVAAQKTDGPFITSSNVDLFTGANSLTSPDKWQVVFDWGDGTPTLFGSNYYGVSWMGWSAADIVTLNTRIDLSTTDEVTVYHWFNDGWNYADGGHSILSGHILTATQYNADGTEVTSESVTLPSGGAESFFGDHRQFYSSIITATATEDGDYLVITNEGANVGYKGTAVALPDSTWYGYNVLSGGYVDTGPDGWLSGLIYVGQDPWIWNFTLNKWIFVPDGPGWVYIPK